MMRRLSLFLVVFVLFSASVALLSIPRIRNADAAPPTITYCSMAIDNVYSPNTPLASVSECLVDGLHINYLRGVFISSDPTNSAAQVRVIVEVTDSVQSVIYKRIADYRSATVFQSVWVDTGSARIPPGDLLRVRVQNLDSVSRRITVYPYLELEAA